MTDWATRLKTFLPDLALRDGTLLLHGSTTAGVDDEWFHGHLALSPGPGDG